MNNYPIFSNREISKVFILIPAHNNKKEVVELLACLNQQTYKDIEIILVDDGSDDGTEKTVKRDFSGVTVLKGDGNLWWTGSNVLGVNYILKEASVHDFILLLNNDLVVKNDYIETLVNASAHCGRAITGSVLVDCNNSDFVESGVRLDHRLDIIANRNKELIDTNEFDFDVDVLPGRGTLMPIEVFKKIENFNQKKLPHYGADYEFSIRAKRAGYKLVVSNRARVFAKLNITGLVTPNKRFLSLRECFELLFSKKSKSNIYCYLNYVWLCSEEKFRVRNMIYGARGIFSTTLLKTIPMYPFKILLFLLLKIVLFLFGSYPVRSCDIEKYGLNLENLLQNQVLQQCQFKERNIFHYHINSDSNPLIKDIPQNEKVKIYRLRRHSFSYLHKLTIVLEKINILMSKK